MTMFAALSRYADFNGRGSRSEYWLFALLLCIIFPITIILDVLIFGQAGYDEYGTQTPLLIFSTIAYLGIIIPSYSAAVRRLHDTNRSGWWLLISFVPLVGGILLLVWSCQKGDPRRNRFGPPPRETPGRIEDCGPLTYDSRYAPSSQPAAQYQPLGGQDSFINQPSSRPFSPQASPSKPELKSSDDGWMDRLEQMAKLRDQGILTDEEFAVEKAALLSSLK